MGEGPSRLQGAPFAAVVLDVATGLAAVGLDYWRTGLFVVAGGLGLAALLRLVLPARDAGLLVVRSRVVDVVVLGGLGVGMGVLAAVVPA